LTRTIEEADMIKLTREEMLQLGVRGNVRLWARLLGLEEAWEILSKEVGPPKALEVLGAEEVIEAVGSEKVDGAFEPQEILKLLVEQWGAAKLVERLQRRMREEEKEKATSKRTTARRRKPPKKANSRPRRKTSASR